MTASNSDIAVVDSTSTSLPACSSSLYSQSCPDGQFCDTAWESTETKIVDGKVESRIFVTVYVVYKCNNGCRNFILHPCSITLKEDPLSKTKCMQCNLGTFSFYSSFKRWIDASDYFNERNKNYQLLKACQKKNDYTDLPGAALLGLINLVAVYVSPPPPPHSSVKSTDLSEVEKKYRESYHRFRLLKLSAGDNPQKIKNLYQSTKLEERRMKKFEKLLAKAKPASLPSSHNPPARERQEFVKINPAPPALPPFSPIPQKDPLDVAAASVIKELPCLQHSDTTMTSTSSPSSSSSSSSPTSISDSLLCCVCWEKPKTFMAAPCNHVSYCEDCIKKIDDCALCRKPIIYKVKVFVQ